MKKISDVYVRKKTAFQAISPKQFFTRAVKTRCNHTLGGYICTTTPSMSQIAYMHTDYDVDSTTPDGYSKYYDRVEKGMDEEPVSFSDIYYDSNEDIYVLSKDLTKFSGIEVLNGKPHKYFYLNSWHEQFINPNRDYEISDGDRLSQIAPVISRYLDYKEAMKGGGKR